MLIQLPRSGAEKRKQNADSCTDFEAAVRRDIASAQVISYGAMVGDWRKRAIDLVVALVTFPIWASVILLFAAWAKLRHRMQVWRADESVGYGGRAFKAWRLCITPRSTDNVILHPAFAGGDQDVRLAALIDGPSWRAMVEHLPRLLNVLRGEMSIIGPPPLAEDQVERLRSGKRYYYSMRPGMVMADLAGNGGGAVHKHYAMDWSLDIDALIFWRAVRTLRDSSSFVTSNRKRIRFVR